MKKPHAYILKKVFSDCRKFWPHLLLILILNTLSVPLVLLKPLPIKILIDSGFGNVELPDWIAGIFPQQTQFGFDIIVLITVALIILVALAENIYVVSIWLLNTFTGEKLVLNFRTMLFNHVQRVSMLYHDKQGPSDSLYRIQNDTSAVKSLFINNLSPIISASITVISMLIVIFTINIDFGWIVLGLVPLLIWLVKNSSSKLKKDWKKVKESESSALSVINEVLSALRVVKSFGKEDTETRRYVSRADEALTGQMKVARTGAVFYFFVGMLFSIATALIIYTGAYKIVNNEITLGELTLLIAYIAQLYGPIEKITRNINDIQSSVTSIERIYELMDKDREVTESNVTSRIRDFKGQFTFSNVSFGYEKSKPVLQNLQFELKASDKVGIIGVTGSGKSTLLSLVCRFYDPDSGEIMVDGNSITDFSVKDYRDQFAYVLQDPVLFSTSIAENIAYSNPDAGMDEIIKAAKAANAHDFISKLPQGYNTLAGTRGMLLSGGERQRISIARAFLKNAPCLILDEPTSALDVNTEATIMESIQELMRGRTTFLVTHRLDTLAMCNVIIHLDKGRIVNFLRDPEPDYFRTNRRLLEISKS